MSESSSSTPRPSSSIDPSSIKIGSRPPAPENITPPISTAEELKYPPAGESVDTVTPEDTGNDLPSPSETVTGSIVDHPAPLDPDSFPDRNPGNSKTPKGTIRNLIFLLDAYDIAVRYDVISKKTEIIIPGSSGCPDNADNSAFALIISLAKLNNLPAGQIAPYLLAIGDKNQYNPVAEWMKIKPWDGEDRLSDFYDTLTEREDFPKTLKETLLYRWLLSAVAAVMQPSGFRARGVLTLQGPQSIGKTGWVSALIPNQILRDACILLDHHLDPGNKDSLITAACHWIVEIGELDSSFKKDIARY